MKNFIYNNISHIGDICAIPLFGISIIYFYNIKNKTILENILLYFNISGFLLDIIFTYQFLSKKIKCYIN